MLVGVLALVLSFLSAGLAGAQYQSLPSRVAAGDVSQTTAVLWARAEEPGTYTFWYRAWSVTGSPWLQRFVTIDDESLPAKVSLTGLVSGATYLYAVQDEGGSYDLGAFRTLRYPGTSAGLRFGVSGDSRGELGPYPSVKNAPGRVLDFFVFLGDTIYADVPSAALPKTQAETVDEFRIKHDEVLSERFGLNALSNLRANAATFAMIDDHEVTNDFAGGAPPSTDPRFALQDGDFINETALFEAGLTAFHDFQPIAERFYGETGDPRTSGKRDLYRVRVFGSDAAIFLLDARSFRDRELPGVSNPLDAAAVAEFENASFDPSRTMLGRAQLERLKSHLLAVESLGVVWKFIFVPEPIQNLGVLGASDRFEGYAAERTELLAFLHDHGLKNVVFVAADFHGTLVNDLWYRTGPGAQSISADAFEVVTGPIAYDPPLGPALVDRVAQAGILDPSLVALYQSLSRPVKDLFVELAINWVMALEGYDPIGLNGSSLRATLLTGRYSATHVYGWTEFAIEPATSRLTVTVYGIDAYTREEMEANPSGVLARTPAIVSRFVVSPK